MNNKLKFFNNCRGSILNNLIAVSILGISTAGLFHYMVNFEQNVQSNLESRENERLISRLVVSNLKALLIATNVNSTGRVSGNRNEYGICSLLTPPAGIQGTQPLSFNFSYIGSRSYNWGKARWQYFFPPTEWKILNNVSACKRLDSGFQASPLSRCLEYTPRGGDSADRTFVIATISPRDFLSGGSQVIPLTTTAKDPKEVIFYLLAKVGTYHHQNPPQAGSGGGGGGASHQQDVSYFHRSTGMVWAGAAGECQVQVGGNWVTVKFVGTGTGTSASHLVINDSLFNNQKACEQIKIGDINKDIVQVGRLRGQNNLSLASILALNTKLSCTTNRFRCKHKIANISEHDIDRFQFSFNLFQGHTGSNNIAIDTINITFKKSDGTEIDGTSNKQLDNVPMYLGDDLQSALNPSTRKQANVANQNIILRGERKVTVTTDTSQMKAHCRNLCRNNISIYPVIDVDLVGDTNKACFRKDFSNEEANKVRCTVCYMRACHRVGLGTFGPLNGILKSEIRSVPHLSPADLVYHGLPDEALDSQLPECYKDSAEGYKRQQLPNSARGLTGSGSEAVVVTVTRKADFKNLYKATYTKMQKGVELPVLCFINGHYLPAVELNVNNIHQPLQPVKKRYKDAEKACYEMGREVGSLMSLALMFAESYKSNHQSSFVQAAQTVNNLGSIGGASAASEIDPNLKYNFINNTTRGMFLAPVNKRYDNLPGSRWMRSLFDSLFKTKSVVQMWTAIEFDKGGLPVAKAPRALVAKNDPYSLFYHKEVSPANSRPVLLRDTTSFNTSSNHLALTYNIRWKGLVPLDPKTKAWFVCYNSHKKNYFINKKLGPLSDAVKLCKNKGGVFMPPTSSGDWVKLMLQLNKNDRKYPFPDPFHGSSGVGRSLNFGNTAHFMISQAVPNPKAWVALRGNVDRADSNTEALDVSFYAPGFDKDSIFEKTPLPSQYRQKGVLVRGIDGKGRLTHPYTHLRNKYKYYTLCVDNSTKLPRTLVRQKNGSCPYGTTKVRGVSSNTSNPHFKPNSYKYLSKLFELLQKKSLLQQDKTKDSKNIVMLNNTDTYIYRPSYDDYYEDDGYGGWHNVPPFLNRFLNRQ